MTAKEYLKQAYLLDKQIQVEVKELEQLREMRGTIQGCSYGEKIGTNPNRNLEAPFIKTIEKIWEYEQKIDKKINRLVDLRSEINVAIEKMENPESIGGKRHYTISTHRCCESRGVRWQVRIWQKIHMKDLRMPLSLVQFLITELHSKG